MRNELPGYWILTWIGLIANVAVLPCIGLVAFSNPDLPLVNFILAISLAWPAAIVGIVAAAGLLAQRKWGVILAIVALSMTLSGTLPYGIVRLVREGDIFGLSGLSFLIAILNLLALIYWCRPAHRKGIRF
ncbi:hypothetical protein [Prochlorococcus sp. MIT 1307]|uniref:hypothetical protein n=1 Tax=Prochlorococcus sp. MIT 1307 TaxID=3096219 RepID=UPI002A75DDCA|nr:hypothetical protein [Prochlorococcus sp. MIT 1307]